MSERHPIGIIVLPSSPKPSRSFQAYVTDLAETVGQTWEITIVRPVPVGGPAIAGHLHRLSNPIDYELTDQAVAKAAVELQNAHGCSVVVIIGFSVAALHATIALNAAAPGAVVGVIAWHPHLPEADNAAEMPLDLSRVACPALVIYADNDPTTTSSLEWFRLTTKNLPEFEIRVVPGTDHTFADRFTPEGKPNPQYQPMSWADAKLWLLGLVREPA